MGIAKVALVNCKKDLQVQGINVNNLNGDLQQPQVEYISVTSPSPQYLILPTPAQRYIEKCHKETILIYLFVTAPSTCQIYMQFKDVCVLSWLFSVKSCKQAESQETLSGIVLSFGQCFLLLLWFTWAFESSNKNKFIFYSLLIINDKFKRQSYKSSVIVQWLSHVQLFTIPWTVALQASLSFTISQSFLKLNSTESVMPSNDLILCHLLLLLPSIFPSIRVFPISLLFASGGQSIGVSASASVLPMNIQG